MPKNIADSNSVSFSPDKMNALQAAGASVIGAVLGDDPAARTSQALSNIRGAVAGNAGQLKDLIRGEVTKDIIGGSKLQTNYQDVQESNGG